MSGKIFISYRRDDSSWTAGRLRDRLVVDFDPGQIFMDVDNIPPGVDFVKEIERQVASCDVLLALIGRLWISSTDDQGNRRIDIPEDFVRIEIGTALRRHVRVIPVLIDRTVMPKPGQLPDRLKALVRRQALELNHNSFKADSDRLIRALKIALEEAAREHQKRPLEREKKRLEAQRQEKDRLEAQRQEKDRLEAKVRKREEWLEGKRKEHQDREGFAAIRCKIEEKEHAARYALEDPAPRNPGSLEGIFKPLQDDSKPSEDSAPTNLAALKDIFNLKDIFKSSE